MYLKWKPRSLQQYYLQLIDSIHLLSFAIFNQLDYEKNHFVREADIDHVILKNQKIQLIWLCL